MIYKNGEWQFNEELSKEMDYIREQFYKNYKYWINWQEATEDAEILDGDEHKLALLWDKKNILKQKVGRIKQKIYNEGLRKLKHNEKYRKEI